MACVCDNFTLYHHGCKCGEIQRERGETPPVQPSDEVPNWFEGQNYELIISTVMYDDLKKMLGADI